MLPVARFLDGPSNPGSRPMFFNALSWPAQMLVSSPFAFPLPEA